MLPQQLRVPLSKRAVIDVYKRQLESLTVLDKDGKALTLTDKGSGKYTFVMPAGKVAVKAVFMDDNTMQMCIRDSLPVHAEGAADRLPRAARHLV